MHDNCQRPNFSDKTIPECDLCAMCSSWCVVPKAAWNSDLLLHSPHGRLLVPACWCVVSAAYVRMYIRTFTSLHRRIWIYYCYRIFWRTLSENWLVVCRGWGWIDVMACVAGVWCGVTCMHMSPQSVEERCKEEQHSNLPPQSVSPMAVAPRDACACTVCSTPLSPWCTELSLSAAPLQLVSSTTGELWCAPYASSAGSYFPVHVYALHVWACRYVRMYVYTIHCMSLLFLLFCLLQMEESQQLDIKSKCACICACTHLNVVFIFYAISL